MKFLAALLACHYLADFCLTWPALIQSKADGRNVWPIALHAAVHALLMGGCLLLYGTGLKLFLLLMVLEWVTHFLIDTMKVRLSAAIPLLADARHKPYWMLYGLDQLLHQIVVAAIWYSSIFRPGGPY